MPPRSFYVAPKSSDYLALLNSRGANLDEQAKAEGFYLKYEVPFIDSFGQLAAYLGVEASILFNILRKIENNYRTFEIEHFNGKIREINSPRTYLKVCQWWILDNVLCKQSHEDCVHGFVKNKSYYTNAQMHFGSNHLLTVDIRSFFPSITQRQVKSVFLNMGYSEEAGSLLADFCTLYNRLPQGAPTSPVLSNLVFRNVDKELLAFAATSGLLYTRYADDLTFSSSDFIDKENLLIIKKIIGSFGFKLNDKKTKFCGRGDRMEVTGVVINDKLQLPRSWRYRAKAMFFQANNHPKEFAPRYDELQGVLNTLIMFADDDCHSPLIKSGKNALKKISGLAKTA